ncbi:DUF2000 domain-containing protein [Nitratidesulfovibrio sp. HK-II]|uniref:DUF2000 domain-containing protein n=1 Tax=Nitratidesulfovibrio sp. HK-II TaxID=2009266 RepID=UPI000E2EC11A|nr:DUF2000 domain-containing protein [Nitratidesulfovibrio sp. HK-II]GBO97936.1 hypothetical protein RVX_2975 [Nitratidesulfovibrio sp. HK-II]
MNLDSTKFAIVLDGGLPGGVAANAAAVLSLSVGRAFPDIVGPAVTDGDGGAHPGITQLPIPVLRAAPEALPDLRRKAAERGLYCVGFTHTARTARSYQAYTLRMAATPHDDLGFVGIAIVGERSAVDGLCGALPTLR